MLQHNYYYRKALFFIIKNRKIFTMSKYSLKTFLFESLFVLVTVIIVRFLYDVGANIAHKLSEVLDTPIQPKTEVSFTQSVFTFVIIYTIVAIIADIFIKKNINTISKRGNENPYRNIKEVILKYGLFLFILSILSFNFSFFLLLLQQKFSFTLLVKEETYFIATTFAIINSILRPVLSEKPSL